MAIRASDVTRVAAGVGALVAAVMVGVGPADAKHAIYRWPPSEAPTATPEAGWYAPLPLLNRVPEAIELTVPCGLSPALHGRGRAIVLSTVRRPDRTPGLVATLEPSRLVIAIDHAQRFRFPWPSSCPLHVIVKDGQLRSPRRTEHLELPTLDDMPVITGLFTSLDLRRGNAPQIVVRTRPFATSWSARQTITAALAVLLICIALALAIPLPSGRVLRGNVHRAWSARDPSDAVVVGLIIAWWIIGPVFLDDSWLAMQYRMLADVGSANLYFDNWGVEPLSGNWLVWVAHRIVGSTHSLVVMRTPALVVLLAAWLLARWCLRSAAGEVSPHARWTLAGAFLVGSTAWGMTLRPEPVICLLALVSLASMLSFSHVPRTAPLATTIVVTALAVAAHPVGVVAAAPPVAASPTLVAWIRRTRPGATIATLVLVGFACGLLLFTLGADLSARLTSGDALSSSAAHGQWWREDRRYTSFGYLGGDNPIRRLSLALMILTVVGLLTRLRSVQTGVSLVPSRSLAAGLLFLTLVPSKLPWHFGSLLGIAAVATSAEVARLMSEGPQWGLKAARGVVAFLLLVLAGIWVRQAGFTAPPMTAWSDLDVRSTHWGSGFALFAWVTALSVLGLTALAVLRMSDPFRMRARHVPSAAAAFAVIVLSLAAVGTTAAVLLVDAQASRWTVGRQNAASFLGREGCGALDELRGDLPARVRRSTARTLIVPSIGLFVPCATPPSMRAGRLEIPDFLITPPNRDRWPVEGLERPFAFVTDLESLRLLRVSHEGALEVYAVADASPYALLPVEHVVETTDG